MSQRYALNDGVCRWSLSLHLQVEAGEAGVRVRTLRRDDTNFGLETSVQDAPERSGPAGLMYYERTNTPIDCSRQEILYTRVAAPTAVCVDPAN